MGIAVAALVADQFIGQPGPAQAAASAPGAQAGLHDVASVTASVAKVVSVSRRLEMFRALLASGTASDGFATPQAWAAAMPLATEAAQSLAASPDQPKGKSSVFADASEGDEHRLTGVIARGAQSAIIDGKLYRLGEERDGIRLIEVHDRQAVIESGNKRVVLSIQDDRAGVTVKRISR